MLASTQDKGLDDSQLQRQLEGVSDEMRIQALNKLIQRSRIQVLQRAQSGVPYFKFIS